MRVPRTVALVALALAAVAAAGCEDRRLRAPERQVVGGDAEAGRRHLERMPCKGCHEIPGVRGARGTVGPPLHRFARRAYIAGALPNRSENLVRWIMDPTSIEPGTAMPYMGIPEARARDIAAYLYTLR